MYKIEICKTASRSHFHGSAYLCLGNSSSNTSRCYFNFRMVVREQRYYHITVATLCMSLCVIEKFNLYISFINWLTLVLHYTVVMLYSRFIYRKWLLLSWISLFEPLNSWVLIGKMLYDGEGPHEVYNLCNCVCVRARVCVWVCVYVFKQILRFQ